MALNQPHTVAGFSSSPRHAPPHGCRRCTMPGNSSASPQCSRRTTSQHTLLPTGRSCPARRSQPTSCTWRSASRARSDSAPQQRSQTLCPPRHSTPRFTPLPAPSVPLPPSLARSILPTPLPSLPLLSPLPPPRALLALAPHFCTPFPVQSVPYFSTPAPSPPTSCVFNRPTPPPWHTRRRSARCSRPWRPAPQRRRPLA